MRLKDVEIIVGYAGADHDGLTDDEVKILRDQEVDTDDWDIMVFASPEILVPREEEYNYSSWYPNSETHGIVKKTRIVYDCVEFSIDRILSTRSYQGTWYLIDWKGKKTALGVAYH